MFTRIHHVGYRVADLDEAIAWYQASFGGTLLGRGPRNAFVQCADAIIELTKASDRDKNSVAAQAGQTLDHVAYEVDDIELAMTEFKARGLRFGREAPVTNVMGWRLIHFESAGCLGTRIHLIQARLDGEA